MSGVLNGRPPKLARLHVLGPDAESFDICAGETIIGRDEPATILLPSSCVSIKHATIGGFSVRSRSQGAKALTQSLPHRSCKPCIVRPFCSLYSLDCLEVSRNGIFHWISDSSTNGTWITRYRNGLETPYRLHSSDKEGEGEIYRYQLVDGEKLKFADMEVIYEVLEPWRTQMGVGHFGAGLPSYTEESSERDNEVAEEQVEEQAEVADNDVGQRRMVGSYCGRSISPQLTNLFAWRFL